MYTQKGVSVLPSERLKAKTEGSKNLTHTGLIGGRGDLRIGTRIRGERLESVRGECDLEAIGVPSIFRLIRNVAAG